MCRHFSLAFCIATSKLASLASQKVSPCQTTVILQCNAGGGEGVDSRLHEWTPFSRLWTLEYWRHPNRFNISSTPSAAWRASISKVKNWSKNGLKTRLKNFSAPSRVQLSETYKAPIMPSITSESAWTNPCKIVFRFQNRRAYIGSLNPEPVLTGGSTLSRRNPLLFLQCRRDRRHIDIQTI